ncbi:hypothetical protein D3C73_1665530 [compost metagenome]
MHTVLNRQGVKMEIGVQQQRLFRRRLRKIGPDPGIVADLYTLKREIGQHLALMCYY